MKEIAVAAGKTSTFFGWHVVAAAFAVAVFAWGIGFYGPSVYLRVLHAERGWPVAMVSAAISLHFLFSAALITFLPEAHRRFGVAAVTRAGAVALALGALAWALVEVPWQLFAAALLSGAGWAATSGAALNAMVAPWFDKRRPAALAMAFNGASLGGVLFTPLWIGLAATFGFVPGAAAVGTVTVLVLWPLAGRYLRSTPAALGMAPDGAATPPPPKPPATRAPVARRALLRNRRFVTVSAAFALGLFAQIGLIAHMVSLLAATLGPGGAAGAVSLATACAVIGRSLLGWLIGDRDRRMAAAANFALQAGGVSLLMLGDGQMPILLAGCVLFGLGIGNLTSLPPMIAQAEFDPVDVPRVVALVVAINQAVFALGPGSFGLLRDATGGYAAPLALAAAVQLAAATIILVGRRTAKSFPVTAVTPAEKAGGIKTSVTSASQDHA